MRVLVLGGSGFIGAAAVRRLRERGATVATFHRGEDADVRGDHGDLPRHRDALARISPEIVVDTIAYTEADAVALVATFRGVARRVVVLSSQDVYAPYGRLLRLEPGAPDSRPSTEESPLRSTRFPYRARAAGPDDMAFSYEKILVEETAASDPALPATILRLPCVYGPGDSHRRVGRVLARLRDGAPVPIDRAKARWCWTRGFVDNVAEAIALASIDPRATGRVYNVGERPALGEGTWIRSIARAARLIAEIREVEREALPADLREPYDFSHDLVADTSLIRRELGYRELIGRDEAIGASVAWESTNRP